MPEDNSVEESPSGSAKFWKQIQEEFTYKDLLYWNPAVSLVLSAVITIFFTAITPDKIPLILSQFLNLSLIITIPLAGFVMVGLIYLLSIPPEKAPFMNMLVTTGNYNGVIMHFRYPIFVVGVNTVVVLVMYFAVLAELAEGLCASAMLALSLFLFFYTVFLCFGAGEDAAVFGILDKRVWLDEHKPADKGEVNEP